MLMQEKEQLNSMRGSVELKIYRNGVLEEIEREHNLMLYHNC